MLEERKKVGKEKNGGHGKKKTMNAITIGGVFPLSGT